MQLAFTLKMGTAQVAKTSVTVNNNSPIQDYVHPDDRTPPDYELTPGLIPFAELKLLSDWILQYLIGLLHRCMFSGRARYPIPGSKLRCRGTWSVANDVNLIEV